MERSKKVVFVSHPILNQNTMPKGTSKASGVVKEVIDVISEAGIGIIQLPCPETEYVGLDRKTKTKDAMDNKKYRKHCQKMAKAILKQAELYKAKKYSIVGILGVERSPTWAVHQLQNGHRNVPGKGILIEEIENAMRKKNFQIPIVGVDLNNLFSSVEKVQSMVSFG